MIYYSHVDTTYNWSVDGNKPPGGCKGRPDNMKEKMKVLLNRLIKWLFSRGMSEKDIVDCINYITSAGKEKPSDRLET